MSVAEDDRTAVERRRMVKKQISGRGIRDPRVLEAMEAVPRHRFVAGRLRKDAYADGPLPIGHGQTISQPFMVATMTQALELQGGERVLEVGTGSGYQAAILGRLGGEVFSVERIEPLAERARRALVDVGARNVTVVVGDGSLGLAAHAPFDAILVAAGMPELHEGLQGQLVDGGRLAAPVGSREKQELVVVRKEGERIVESRSTPCIFVPLIGAGGWPEPSNGGQGSPRGGRSRRVRS